MKNIKEFILGTSIFWMPIVACYIANAITKIIL